MKIKLTETQLKRVLKEVGGYDSPEVMATHAGPLHSIINGNTMELLMLVSKLASAVRDEELNRTELVNGIFNLNQKISDYVKNMPDFVREIYVDDDFKTILKSFISALVKINKYFRMLVGSGQNDGGSFYTGLSFDMTQDELGLKVAEQIATLTDKIHELGEMIVSINQRFNDRTSSMNEQMEFEPKGMDFWLEELSEFAIHLENGVYDKHDELSFDDLTEYDIEEIQGILEDAMEDKSLSDNERTMVFEYGQGIIDSIQRKL